MLRQALLYAGSVGMLMLVGCSPASLPGGSAMTDAITITSPAFTEDGAIPARHTCDGEDVSPPLAWSDVPDGTATFALIVDDPDARGWIHWLAADIPADQATLEEGASGSSAGTQGRNDFGRTGYGGPCPPSGSHRYAFEIFALSEAVNLSSGFSADELRSAMEGKVLASGRLTATYRRGG
jgi:Raf kinase inhibitor-like YbhB/YbcL family protein